jgi:hypothetical protein
MRDEGNICFRVELGHSLSDQVLTFTNNGVYRPHAKRRIELYRESHCSRWKGLEPQHRGASLFYGSMILLNHVVEVSARTHLHLAPAVIFLTQGS